MITNPYPGEDQFLPTRQSLLIRLKNLDDNASWYEFFQNYWRFIYRVAVGSGLSDSEAQDVVQKTVIAVCRQMPTFTYDRSKGTFKGYVYKKARYFILDQQREHKKKAHWHANLPPGTSGTDPMEKLVDPASLTQPNWDEEWELNLAQAAIQNVKAKIKPKHFQIFDWYVLKQMPSKKVATMLGISIGQVFLAKHRITGLISKELRKLKRQSDSGTNFSNGTETLESA